MEKYITNDNSNRGQELDMITRRLTKPTRVDAIKEEIDKPDKPIWRGDHSFSSDAAKYSFLNFIEPDVAGEHPDWSQQKVRSEAMKRFEQRMAQDLQYEQKETDHVETAVQWHIVETGPGQKELATEYGGEMITLATIWEHTREYAAFVGNPAAYNEEEEKAQLAMERAFVRGETDAYISVLSHPDAVRYVQVWERGEDGDVISKQVDLYKTTGRDFSQQEGELLVAHLANYEGQLHGSTVEKSDAAYAHFMLKNGQISEQEIRTIARVVSSRVDGETQSELQGVPDSSSRQRLHVISDIRTSIASVATYVTREIQTSIQKLREPSIRTAVSQQQEQSKRVKKQLSEHKKTQQTTQENINDHTSHPEVIISQASEHIPDEASNAIKSVLSEWVITQMMVSMGGEHPQMAGAALYWLLVLTDETCPVVSESLPNVPLKIGETIVQWVHNIRTVFDRARFPVMPRLFKKVDVQNQQHKQIDTMIEGDKKPPVLQQKSMVVRMVETLEAIPLVKQVTHVWKEILRRVTKDTVAQSESSPLMLKQDEVAFSIGIFILTRWLRVLPTVGNADRRPNIFWRKKNESIRNKQHRLISVLEERGKQKEIEHLVGESPLWVLLSIIWHLAMIREAGMIASTQQNGNAGQAVSTSGLVPVLPTPTSGIIYIYNEENEELDASVFVIE